MKIARIVLTATILFSLKSTLFCSSSATIEPEIVTAPREATVKKPGYDASKKGWLPSSNKWMLENMGSSYKHYTTECEVRPESDDEDTTKSNGSRARWTKIGKEDVTTPKHAQTFLTWTAKLNLPQEANQPSLDIIAADKAIKIQENFETFDDMQQKSRSLLAQIVKINADRKTVDHERNQFFAREITKITQTKVLEFSNREIERNEQDTKITSDLKDILEKTKIFRHDHNTKFPENPINATPVVKRDDINKLNAKTLADIALKYNAALKDAAK
jgi:hypothetical protein